MVKSAISFYFFYFQISLSEPDALINILSVGVFQSKKFVREGGAPPPVVAPLIKLPIAIINPDILPKC